jgi:hypothetical protein
VSWSCVAVMVKDRVLYLQPGKYDIDGGCNDTFSVAQHHGSTLLIIHGRVYFQTAVNSVIRRSTVLFALLCITSTCTSESHAEESTHTVLAYSEPWSHLLDLLRRMLLV